MRSLDEVLTVGPHPELEGMFAVLPHVAARGEREPVATYANRSAAWHHACWHIFHETNTLPEISPGNWFVSTSGKGWTSDPRFAATVPADSVTEHERYRIDRAIVRFIRAKLGDMEPLEAFFPEDVTPDTELEGERLVNGVPAPAEVGEALAQLDGSPASAVSLMTGLDPEELESLGGVPEFEVDEHGKRVPAGESESGCSPTCAPHLVQFCSPECEEEAVSATESPSPGLPEVPEGESLAVDSEAVRSAPSDSEPEPLEGLSDTERNAFLNFSDLAETAPSEQARIYWRNRASEIFAGVLD